jgi:hypothetical protein
VTKCNGCDAYDPNGDLALRSTCARHAGIAPPDHDYLVTPADLIEQGMDREDAERWATAPDEVRGAG